MIEEYASTKLDLLVDVVNASSLTKQLPSALICG